MTRSVHSQTRPGLLTRLVPSRLRSVWRDALSLLLALGDRRTPASARLVAALALLYTVSPIDLLPDSIPFVGYGDDLLIVPALLAFAARICGPQPAGRGAGPVALPCRPVRGPPPLAGSGHSGRDGTAQPGAGLPGATRNRIGAELKLCR